MTLLSSLLLSLILTIVLIPLFSRLAMRLNIYDVPDARKVHQRPMPRIGGLAIAIGALASIVLWTPLDAMIRAYLMAALILVASGIIDDWKGLGFKAKFAAQIAATLIAMLYGDIRIVKLGVLLPDGVIMVDWVSALLTLVAFVGVTNAINLADGLDGLAGGICMLSFCCIGYLAFLEQNFAVAIPAAALVGAIFGFLRFNTSPATLFMGDTGSQLLGFSAIYFSLALTQGDTALSPLLPLIILGFPVLDTLTVMGERIAQGRSPFEADKNHLHHRLMRMGLFDTESVFFIYVIQAFLIVSAFVLRFYSEWLLLVSYLIFAGLVLAFFHWADATGWKLPRFDLIDRAIKGRLRVLRGKGFFIKVTFRFVEFCAPLFLIFLCFLPADVPLYFSISSAIVAALFGIVWIFRREWTKWFLMLVLYAFIPLVIYITETDMAPWMNNFLMNLYNISFLLLAVLCSITLRLTRRKKGFKLTPMDFLVLFITLGLFALPDLRAQFGNMAMKTIMLFFTYEIILGEVREKVGKVALLTVTAFVIVAVRGVVG